MKTRAVGMITLMLVFLRGSALGAPLIYQATGKTPADIQSVVDLFRRDISKGGVNNADLPGRLPNGWREISGDDLIGLGVFPASSIDFAAKGTLWKTPAIGNFLVSDAPKSPDDPNRNFGTINPSYAEIFQTFESTRLIGVDRRIAWSLGFAIPGPEFQLSQSSGINAIGIVFTDVDVERTAGITLGGGELGTFFAPPAAGTGNLSFLGLRFDDGTLFNSASIFAGNYELSSFNEDGRRIGPRPRNPGARVGGSITDVVAIGKVIFAEPIPEASVTLLMLMGSVVLLALRILRKTLTADHADGRGSKLSCG